MLEVFMFQTEHDLGNHNKVKIDFSCNCGAKLGQVLKRPVINMAGESRSARANPEMILVYCQKCNKSYPVTIDADFGSECDIFIEGLEENAKVNISGVD